MLLSHTKNNNTFNLTTDLTCQVGCLMLQKTLAGFCVIVIHFITTSARFSEKLLMLAVKFSTALLVLIFHFVNLLLPIGAHNP